MRIATRLTALFVLLTIIVSLGVGWFAVVMSARAQYATLDGAINTVIDSGVRNPNTALNNALYAVQRNNYDLTLDVVSPSGAVTQVSTAQVPMVARPTLADVRSSLHQTVAPANLAGFEIHSLNVGGGDYLVVAASTSGIRKRDQHLAVLVASAAAVIALFALLLARLVMRGDLRTMERLIDYAGNVADGRDAGSPPPSEGSRDLRELRGALAVMVDALRGRIEDEARHARAMQQFIDDASHELRTPLTVVKGYHDLLDGADVSDEQRARALKRVRREIERMELLVSDLLLLAQVREAPRDGERIFDLGAVVNERVSDFVVESGRRGVRWSVVPGAYVRGRDDFVERLVTNALSNVERHTPPDAPVRVTVTLEGDVVVLVIEDGGPGLPIYGERPQRFQRFDESRSRETGGSGLGMSIMADVVDTFGGTMTTEPSELGGLAIRIQIPLEEAPPSPASLTAFEART